MNKRRRKKAHRKAELKDALRVMAIAHKIFPLNIPVTTERDPPWLLEWKPHGDSKTR